MHVDGIFESCSNKMNRAKITFRAFLQGIFHSLSPMGWNGVDARQCGDCNGIEMLWCTRRIIMNEC